MDENADDSDSTASSSFCSQLFEPLFRIWPGMNTNGQQQPSLNNGAQAPAPAQNPAEDDSAAEGEEVLGEVDSVRGEEQMEAEEDQSAAEDNSRQGTSSSSTTIASRNSTGTSTKSSSESVASSSAFRTMKTKRRSRRLHSGSESATMGASLRERLRRNANKPSTSGMKPQEKRRRANGPLAKRRRERNYSRYIYIILKQVCPDLGITVHAMDCMNSFMNDMFERLAIEASRVAALNRKLTVTEREIQTAVRLVLPLDLANYANLEGTKAVKRYRKAVRVDLEEKARNQR